MEISYQLTREDYEEYLCAAWSNLHSLAGTSDSTLAWNLAIYVPLGIAALAVFSFLFEYSGPEMAVLYVAAGALVWYCIVLLVWNLQGKKRYFKSAVLDDGWFLSPATLNVTPRGISTHTGTLGFELAWSGILALQQTSKLILLFFDGTGALVIPKRAFSDQDELAEFISAVESGMGR